jgi:hypothetical protein
VFKKSMQDFNEKPSLLNAKNILEANIKNVFSSLLVNNAIPQIKNLDEFRNSFEHIWELTGTKIADDLVSPITIPCLSSETIEKLSSLGNINAWVAATTAIEKVPAHWFAKDWDFSKAKFSSSPVPSIAYEQLFKKRVALLTHDSITPSIYTELDADEISYNNLLNAIINDELISIGLIQSELYPLNNELIYAISYFTQYVYIYAKIVKLLKKKTLIKHINSIFSSEETNSYKITPQVSKCPPPALFFA